MRAAIQPGHNYLIEHAGRQFHVRAIDFACQVGLWWCEEATSGRRVFAPKSAFIAPDRRTWRACSRFELQTAK